MTRQCIFCGGTPVTNEHVFPKWVSKLFPTSESRKMLAVGSDLVKGGPTPIKQRSAVDLDSQVKVVCGKCNNGWMGDLEGSVNKIISNIVKSQKSDISLEDQKFLARWAAKTAIMIQYFEHKPTVPEYRRKWLYTHHTPSSDTQIWIARYDGGRIAIAEWRKIPYAHSILFNIGSLFFLVHSSCNNDTPKIEFSEELSPHLFQIWPPGNTSITWPLMGIDDSLRQKLLTPRIAIYILPDEGGLG